MATDGDFPLLAEEETPPAARAAAAASRRLTRFAAADTVLSAAIGIVVFVLASVVACAHCLRAMANSVLRFAPDELEIFDKDFGALLFGEHLLLDVRSADEFAGRALHGSLNVPCQTQDLQLTMAAMSGALGTIQKTTPIVVYCAVGVRSDWAKDALLTLGYTTVKNGGSLHRVQSALARTLASDRQAPSEASEGLRATYSFTSRLYDILDFPWERRLYSHWRPSLAGDMLGPEVLELGVGTGRNLAHYPPSARVTGVDLCVEMIAKARARARAEGTHPSPRLLVADATALPSHLLANATDSHPGFDCVLSTFLFCVLPDEMQPAALREIERALRPGGRFRLVEIVFSNNLMNRRVQQLYSPLVRWLYGAEFDRSTLEHIRRAPGLVVDTVRWLKHDTHLVIDGHKQ